MTASSPVWGGLCGSGRESRGSGVTEEERDLRPAREARESPARRGHVTSVCVSSPGCSW